MWRDASIIALAVLIGSLIVGLIVARAIKVSRNDYCPQLKIPHQRNDDGY